MLVLAMEFSRDARAESTPSEEAPRAYSLGTEDRLEPASTAPRRFLPRKQQSPTTGQTEDGAKPVINWEFLSRM